MQIVATVGTYDIEWDLGNIVHTPFSSVSPPSHSISPPPPISKLKSPARSSVEARGEKRSLSSQDEAKKVKIAKRSTLTIEEPSDSPPKGLKFLIPPNNRCSSKISSVIKHTHIRALHEKLSTKQVFDFANSCFGQFLTMPEFKIQNQLIHNLLLRELQQPNPHEIWVGIDGMELRFGIGEFALITGLRCVGSLDKLKYVKNDNGFCSTYFKDHLKITKKMLKECFDEERWQNDEDALKISLMHFLQNFLLSSADINIIPKEDFNILDSGAFSEFAWGKEVFKDTIESLKNRIVGKKKQKDKKKDGKKKEKHFYRLLGFPYAFQVWFYECCPYLNGSYCHLSRGSIPRIVNWSCSIQPSFLQVTEVLSLKVAELKLRNLTPTLEERANTDLEDFFPKKKNVVEVDNDVPEVATVTHGVDAFRDDDFVENPPQSVVGDSSSVMPSMSQFSLSQMQAQLLRLETSNKVVVSELSSLKNYVHEGFSRFDKAFSKLHDLFSSHRK